MCFPSVMETFPVPCRDLCVCRQVHLIVSGTNLQVENTNVTAARSLLTTLGAADTHLSPMTHLEASSVF